MERQVIVRGIATGVAGSVVDIHVATVGAMGMDWTGIFITRRGVGVLIETGRADRGSLLCGVLVLLSLDRSERRRGVRRFSGR